MAKAPQKSKKQRGHVLVGQTDTTYHFGNRAKRDKALKEIKAKSKKTPRSTRTVTKYVRERVIGPDLVKPVEFKLTSYFASGKYKGRGKS